MIYTSYFAKYRGRNGVSIARTQPTTHPEYPDLMPSWYLLKDYKNNNIDEAEYEHEYYRDVLSHLDPAKVAADLNGKVLLCWERPENFCHRHIVAEWLNKHGYLVEELTGSRERIIDMPDLEEFKGDHKNCLWCSFGKLRTTKPPILLKCTNPESKNYSKITNRPTRRSCEEWRYKY